MKNIFFISIVLILFSFSSDAASNDKISTKSKRIIDHYPIFEEVLTHLYDQLETGCDNCSFNIAKMPNGYFLQIKEQKKPFAVLEEVVLWEANSKEFINIEIDRIEKYLKSKDSYPAYLFDERYKEHYDEYDFVGLEHLLNTRSLSFDFMLFYGYDEANEDIIDFLDGENNLCLEDLENLARSYDHYAGNCIHPTQWNNTPDFAKNYKLTNFQKIESYRIDKFLKVVNKSLSFYDEIVKKDPDYETHLIGNVELKRANNCMHYYSSLRSVREDKLAEQFLELADYPQRYIQMAKTYLDDCSPNSILITNGDSDTYPLWYVQDKLGYRKDVAVLNASLMGTTWYLKMNKEKHQLKMQLDLDACFENEIGFAYINDNKKDTYDQISTLINEFNNNIRSSTEQGYVSLNVGKLYDVIYQDTMLYVKLKQQYLLLSDLALLDIIQNNPTKKVHFASSYYLRSFGWNNNYKQRMIACELTPNPEFEKYDAISKKLIEKNINNINVEHFRKLGGFRNSILLNYYFYLSDLYRNEPDKAKELFNIIDGKLPDNLFYDVESLDILLYKYLIKGVFKNEDIADFENNFNSHALKHLKQIKITPINCIKNYEILNDIYRIYELLINNSLNKDVTYSNEDYNKILNIIIRKINLAEENNALDNLKWTKEKYLSLKNKAEELKTKIEPVNEINYNASYIEGKKLFKGLCSSCHHPTRNGTGPALKGNKQTWIDYAEKDLFYEFIRNPSEIYHSGKSKRAKYIWNYDPSVMPPMNLSNDEIDAIYDYIENCY